MNYIGQQILLSENISVLIALRTQQRLNGQQSFHRLMAKYSSPISVHVMPLSQGRLQLPLQPSKEHHQHRPLDHVRRMRGTSPEHRGDLPDSLQIR